MKSLKYGMLTLALASAVAMPFEAFAQFDYRQSLPYRDGYRRDIRGPVYFSEGDRLPGRYLRGEFVVHDWWGNNLKRPPRGAQWVRVNNQFLMVSLNNGFVKKVVRIEDRTDRDWGGPDRARPTPEFPYRGPPPRLNDRADQEARWRDRYHRTFVYNDDSYYRECQSRPDAAGVVIGAVLGGLLGNAAGGRKDSGLATVAGVIAGGAIAASLTNKLDCDDRAYAYRTYTDGFNAGRENTRYEWRNPRNNNRGEFIVNDYYDDPDGFRCAEYTQKIYIDGRPQEGRGRACRQPDGAWAMID
jgi:surface antigen/Ni/Co efflux regulator RcnB